MIFTFQELSAVEYKCVSVCANRNVLLFMLMGSDVSELRPPAGLLFIPRAIYEHGGKWWNDIDRENGRTRRKPCPSATLSTTNPTWTDPGMNPGLHGENLVTNHLSHGTALKQELTHLQRTL
jgi:hypothetical protein